MAKRLDWDAAKWRKRRPLITAGEERELKRQARQLADRVKKGHRNPQAHLHGKVRTFTEDEKLAYATNMGWDVAPPKPPPSSSPKKSASATKQTRRTSAQRSNKRSDIDDVPWWNEPEWALRTRGSKS